MDPASAVKAPAASVGSRRKKETGYVRRDGKIKSSAGQVLSGNNGRAANSEIRSPLRTFPRDKLHKK